jgi:hypothetical protein
MSIISAERQLERRASRATTPTISVAIEQCDYSLVKKPYVIIVSMSTFTETLCVAYSSAYNDALPSHLLALSRFLELTIETS